jgi:DNA invertase Pin-like site-specific DNA recombinase
MPELNSTQELLNFLVAGKAKAPQDVDTASVRYALYTRKSTTSEDRQASSIEDQIDDCYEKVIVPNGLNVVRTYQESYSAKVADLRDQFNDMIKQIELGNIDGVIAWHPDRLARNMKEAGAIIDFVDKGAIRDLQFATFTFENTPAGKMLLGITFVMAKQYSEHLAESVDRGNKRAIEDGEFIGKFKHGYVLDINRYFRPDPLSFDKVQHMFEMALNGKSQKDIRLWINEQDYTVQKRQGDKHVPHKWDKDDVSKLLRDPHYVGVHKWGKTHTDLTQLYDFKPMLTVPEFLTINKIDSLDNAKILAMHSPRGGNIKADLLRGMVYCGECNKTLTSMLIPKRDRTTGEVKEARYYYKCETEGCPMYDKSARAGFVIDAAQDFFMQYLFITASNYSEYLKQADVEAKRKSAEFDTAIASLKIKIANKDKVYEEMKDFILKNPDMKEHYDLDKHVKAIEKLKTDYKRAILQKDNIKAAIPTFEEYLKLLQSTPVALGKIRDMKTMDALLRIFFSNFTINLW